MKLDLVKSVRKAAVVAADSGLVVAAGVELAEVEIAVVIVADARVAAVDAAAGVVAIAVVAGIVVAAAGAGRPLFCFWLKLLDS